MTSHLRIAVALAAQGWHPGAAPLRAPAALSTWRDLIGGAEAAGVDLVTLEDSFALNGHGHLDALLIASAIAPSTSRIGLVPTVTTAHTEPFHVATGLQTLDHVSRGRAGWLVGAGDARAEAPLFGRRDASDLSDADLLAEAADVVEASRLLWDSWQDDAVIRDVATGRYLDRDRIHPAAFRGRFFSIEGASIVPRSPQGQLPVTVVARTAADLDLAARHADAVFATPQDDAGAVSILRDVRDAEGRVARVGEPLRVFADVLVLLEDTPAAALAALGRLDDEAGAPAASDALIAATTADDLAARIAAWHDLGYDGVRLRPARLPDDLTRIGRDVLPILEAAGRHRPARDGTTLRASLGLPQAESRFTALGGSTASDSRSDPTAKGVLA